jgi:small subunit ribosomal protein S9
MAPFSTSQPRKEVEAAPPIDLKKLERLPARIMPASPSYFSGIPRFTDDLLEAQDILRKYAHLPTLPPIEARRRGWIKLAAYRGRIGEVAPSAKFSKILQVLKRLNRIHPDLMPKEVQVILDKYMSGSDPGSRLAIPLTVDEDGKSRGVGRRKAASAKVYLVEGEGEVLINGRNILQVFPRLHDRESALWPLKVTNRMDKYNVWALVKGGGVTGQAEAITLGLAKALMVHEPMLKSILRKGTLPYFFLILRGMRFLCPVRSSTLLYVPAALVGSTHGTIVVLEEQLLTRASFLAGCVTRDPRRVERKKHGHVKARKMPQWVKR